MFLGGHRLAVDRYKWFYQRGFVRKLSLNPVIMTYRKEASYQKLMSNNAIKNKMPKLTFQ